MSACLHYAMTTVGSWGFFNVKDDLCCMHDICDFRRYLSFLILIMKRHFNGIYEVLFRRETYSYTVLNILSLLNW